MKYLFQVCILGFLSNFSTLAQNHQPEIKFKGVEVRSVNLEEAVEFYSGKLGFNIKDKNFSAGEILLVDETMDFRLKQVLKPNKINYATQSYANIAFQVNTLLPAIDKLREQGIKFEEDKLLRNGIGIGIPFFDPSGNRHFLVEQQVRQTPEFKGIKIYNVGFKVPDINEARKFYVEKLGFEVYSENYLPAALPLKHKAGSLAFMLHFDGTVSNSRNTDPDESQTVLVFESSDLERTVEYLKDQDVTFISFYKLKAVFSDPFGNILLLIEKNK